ncbi:hypothetical protein MIR68_005422 [Amoeboaphelidium protococcarum]|nr:hypothetical protein MIR68_005422 [Amoeboaphelidium protococcarum]
MTQQFANVVLRLQDPQKYTTTQQQDLKTLESYLGNPDSLQIASQILLSPSQYDHIVQWYAANLIHNLARNFADNSQKGSLIQILLRILSQQDLSTMVADQLYAAYSLVISDFELDVLCHHIGLGILQKLKIVQLYVEQMNYSLHSRDRQKLLDWLSRLQDIISNDTGLIIAFKLFLSACMKLFTLQQVAPLITSLNASDDVQISIALYSALINHPESGKYTRSLQVLLLRFLVSVPVAQYTESLMQSQALDGIVEILQLLLLMVEELSILECLLLSDDASRSSVRLILDLLIRLSDPQYAFSIGNQVVTLWAAIFESCESILNKYTAVIQDGNLVASQSQSVNSSVSSLSLEQLITFDQPDSGTSIYNAVSQQSIYVFKDIMSQAAFTFLNTVLNILSEIISQNDDDVEDFADAMGQSLKTISFVLNVDAFSQYVDVLRQQAPQMNMNQIKALLYCLQMAAEYSQFGSMDLAEYFVHSMLAIASQHTELSHYCIKSLISAQKCFKHLSLSQLQEVFQELLKLLVSGSGETLKSAEQLCILLCLNCRSAIKPLYMQLIQLPVTRIDQRLCVIQCLFHLMQDMEADEQSVLIQSIIGMVQNQNVINHSVAGIHMHLNLILKVLHLFLSSANFVNVDAIKSLVACVLNVCTGFPRQQMTRDSEQLYEDYVYILCRTIVLVVHYEFDVLSLESAVSQALQLISSNNLAFQSSGCVQALSTLLDMIGDPRILLKTVSVVKPLFTNFFGYILNHSIDQSIMKAEMEYANSVFELVTQILRRIPKTIQAEYVSNLLRVGFQSPNVVNSETFAQLLAKLQDKLELTLEQKALIVSSIYGATLENKSADNALTKVLYNIARRDPFLVKRVFTDIISSNGQNYKMNLIQKLQATRSLPEFIFAFQTFMEKRS